MISRFLRDESGATAIEYGLMAALISVAIVTAVGLVGDALTDSFSNTATQVADALP